MKSMIKFSLLVAIAVAGFINPINAQDATKELAAFTKKFEQAYNNKDDASLRKMYTKDAVRTGTDGKITTGNEAIGALFAEFFKDNVSLVLKQENVFTGADGSTTATGSYHVTGTSSKGDKIDRKGTYNNTVVKEDGEWKISNNVLTAL